MGIAKFAFSVILILQHGGIHPHLITSECLSVILRSIRVVLHVILNDILPFDGNVIILGAFLLWLLAVIIVVEVIGVLVILVLLVHNRSVLCRASADGLLSMGDALDQAPERLTNLGKNISDSLRQVRQAPTAPSAHGLVLGVSCVLERVPSVPCIGSVLAALTIVRVGVI